MPSEVAVVSHDVAYGASVISDPKFAPSNLNWTPAIPRLDEALAETVTIPETVAPPPGAVMETVGRGTVFVRLKLAGVDDPDTVAVTVYVPPVPFALKAGAVATPLAFVGTLAVFKPPVNVPLGPLAGAVNVTVTPLSGLLLASFTVAANAVAKLVLTLALCGVPAV